VLDFHWKAIRLIAFQHALGVVYAPIVDAKGLRTIFSDRSSKEARMALLSVAVKGYNVLQLREPFNDFPRMHSITFQGSFHMKQRNSTKVL
jgi:hypothetical protein